MQKRPFVKTAAKMPSRLRMLTLITSLFAAASVMPVGIVAGLYALPLLLAVILEPYLFGYGRLAVGVGAVILNFSALPFLGIYSVLGAIELFRGHVYADFSLLIVLMMPVALAVLLYFDWEFIRWNRRVEAGTV